MMIHLWRRVPDRRLGAAPSGVGPGGWTLPDCAVLDVWIIESGGPGVQLRAGSGCKLALAAAGGMMAVVIGLLVTGGGCSRGRLYHG
jgi:hypothetical protein